MLVPWQLGDEVHEMSEVILFGLAICIRVQGQLGELRAFCVLGGKITSSGSRCVSADVLAALEEPNGCCTVLGA